MKKFLLILLASVVFTSNSSFAAEKKVSYSDEAAALGSIAGQGLACRAKKYHKFELLARAIVVSKAKSNQMQEDGLRAYNEAKAGAFMDIESEKFSDCDEIVYAFNRQKIFDAVLYRNGKIKMPDGTMIIPRKEYDVSKLYKKDPEAFSKAEEAYKKSIENAQKNNKNRDKIKLYDANYQKFSSQFD